MGTVRCQNRLRERAVSPVSTACVSGRSALKKPARSKGTTLCRSPHEVRAQADSGATLGHAASPVPGARPRFIGTSSDKRLCLRQARLRDIDLVLEPRRPLTQAVLLSVQIVQIVHFDTFCAFCVVLCGLIQFVRNVSFCAV